jgi:hypothetical protein
MVLFSYAGGKIQGDYAPFAALSAGFRLLSDGRRLLSPPQHRFMCTLQGWLAKPPCLPGGQKMFA